MRFIRNISRLFLAVLLALPGCTGRIHRSSVEKDRRTAAESRFDPLAFPGDNAMITGQGKSTKSLAQPDHDLVLPENLDFTPQPSHPQGESEAEQPLVIFRVQVFASKSFSPPVGDGVINFGFLY